MQFRILAALALTASALAAQTQAPDPAFEVASIKPSPPLDASKVISGQMHVGLKIDEARVDIGYLSLSDLIMAAYKVRRYQLVGPDWLTAQRFDIMATIPKGVSKDKVPEMLQALLAERFKLVVHHENREHPIYALTVLKGGPKLKEAAPEPAEPEKPAAAEGGRGEMVIGAGENQMKLARNADGKGVTVSNAQFGKMNVAQGEGGTIRMEFSKMSMAVLAEMLTQLCDRPVMDMTELKGNFQVPLELGTQDLLNVARAAGLGGMLPAAPPAEPGKAPVDAASDSGRSIFAAVQKLGLKLEARKAPADTIVVDRVEKMPTEN